jgi:hypothetical protein
VLTLIPADLSWLRRHRFAQGLTILSTFAVDDVNATPACIAAATKQTTLPTLPDMDARQRRDVHTPHSTKRDSGATEIRQVHNVAFANATAKAGVSPWTPAMFKVSRFMD